MPSSSSPSGEGGGNTRVGTSDKEEDSVESHYRLRTDKAPLKQVERENLGQLFFFCDMRRAVIIVNLVTIFISVGFLLLLFLTRRATSQIQETFDDDQVQSVATQWNELKDEYYVYHVFVRIVCAAVGVIGAIRFNRVLTGFSALSLILDFCVSAIYMDWTGIFMAPIFFYPHLIFLKYLRSGLMSPENYHNEMQSCCCV